MKSWNKNWNIPAFLIFNILLFAGLFYFDLHRNINIGAFESIGTVSFKINSIQRKFESAVVWHSIQSNSPLRDKDTIKTYPESDALIKLNDGTEIQVDENTMIYLDFTGNSPNINFEGGTIQINSSKGRDPNKQLIVKTKNQTIKLSGSDAKIDSSGSDGINVSLDKGKAIIEGKGDSKELNPNEIATLGESGVSTRKVPFALQEPENQKKFISTSSSTPISFRWTATGSNTNPTFELSRLRDFKRVDTKLQNVASANLNLPQGTYFWRVSGKNSSGAIEYSESRKFILIKETGLQLFSPSNGATISSAGGNPNITFAWTPSETVSQYTLELADNSNFTSTIKSIPVSSNSIGLNSLGEGTYFWRVTTKPSSDGISSIRSSVSSFTIGTKQPPAKTPTEIKKDNKKEITKKEEEKKELAKVEEKKIEEKKREEKKVEEKKKIENESIAGLSPEHISPVAGTVDISKDKQIQFRWDKVKPATHYVVKISEAGKKTKTLLNEKVTNNSYTLKNFSKFSEGTFLWDVTPYDKKNSPGKTARGKFTIDLSNDGLKNLKPEEIKILSPDTIYRDK